MHLILYSKPGCHLCEGLQEKLEQIESIPLTLEVRDINTREEWALAYAYEIPVLYLVKDNGNGEKGQEIRLPRLSPRATVKQVEAMLRSHRPDS